MLFLQANRVHAFYVKVVNDPAPIRINSVLRKQLSVFPQAATNNRVEVVKFMMLSVFLPVRTAFEAS